MKQLLVAVSLLFGACTTSAPMPRFEVMSAYVVPSADLVVAEVARQVQVPCGAEECEEEYDYVDLRTIMVHGATARISGQGRPEGPTTPLIVSIDPEDTDTRPLEFPMPPRFSIKTAPDSEFELVQRTPDGTGWLYRNLDLEMVALLRASGAFLISADISESSFLGSSNTRIQLAEVRGEELWYATVSIDRPKVSLTLNIQELAVEEGELGLKMNEPIYSESGLLIAFYVLDQEVDGVLSTSKKRVAVYDMERKVRVRTIESEHPTELAFVHDHAVLLVRRPRPTDPTLSFMALNSEEESAFEKPFSINLRRQVTGSMVRAFFQQDSVVYIGPSGEKAQFPRPRGAVLGSGPIFYQLFAEESSTILVQFDIVSGEEVELGRFGLDAMLLGQISAGLVVIDLHTQAPGALIHVVDPINDTTDIIPLTVEYKGSRIPVHGRE